MRGKWWSIKQKATLAFEIEVLQIRPSRTSFVKSGDRTYSQVKNMVTTLRKEGRIKHVFNSGVRGDCEPYTAEEIRIIQKHTVGEGVIKPVKRLGPKALARLLPGRTEGAISAFIKKKGWANPERSLAIRQAGRLQPDKKARIVRFMEGRGRYWPPSLLAEKFGISKDTARSLRKKHDLWFTHEEAMQNSRWYRKWYHQSHVANGLAARAKFKKNRS